MRRPLLLSGLSPCTADLDESLNALKYAHRVSDERRLDIEDLRNVLQASQIRNKPIKNVDPNARHFIEMQSEIMVSRSHSYRATRLDCVFA